MFYTCNNLTIVLYVKFMKITHKIETQNQFPEK